MNLHPQFEEVVCVISDKMKAILSVWSVHFILGVKTEFRQTLRGLSGIFVI